jgi:phosphonate transport system substrate-binding protein
MYKWFILLLSLLPLGGEVVADTRLVLGVHPYLPPIELIERFTPLAKYLERSLGVPVVVKVGITYQAHNDRVVRGENAISFIGPANYARLRLEGHRFTESLRLSFSGNTRFRGAIVTNSTSGIRRLDDAKGRRMALGDPNSTLSALVPIYMLKQQGIELSDLSKYTHLKNHHNVALSILVGKYDIGGVKEEVFREYAPRGLVRLQYTDWFPSHLFVIDPSLPPDLRSRIRQAMLNLHKAKNGREILSIIKAGTTELVDNEESDFTVLMEIVRNTREGK